MGFEKICRGLGCRLSLGGFCKSLWEGALFKQPPFVVCSFFFSFQMIRKTPQPAPINSYKSH
nr:MAG TPA: hypothetical protein [Caudoviricetes sp.]